MVNAIWAAIAMCFLPAAPAAQHAPSLQQLAAERIAAFERTSGAVVGASAVDLKTGRNVVEVRGDELFLPASNQKLLTSAFALVRLGAGFRFVTGVFAVGRDVVVAGEGDPTLGDPVLAARAGRSIYAELDRWAAAVKARCGPAVRDVLVCTPPGRGGRHSDWPAAQSARWYAAPVSTLNFHDNCFDVTFTRVAGGPVPVVSPQSRFVRVVNRLKAGRSHLWSLRTADEGATVLLTGTVAKATDDSFSVAVDRPAMLLGRVLAGRLDLAGVAVTGRVRPVAPGQVDWARARAVCRTSTPLFAAMARANKRSLNLAAEAIFLRAGDGTWSGSAEMMTRTLTRAFSLPPGSIAPADGGGLSRRNRVSPGALTRVLAGLAKRPDVMVMLMSLPVGGVDGTLAKRFTQPPCRGRVVAKTGYIYRVSTLSGYVLDEDGSVRVAFSVLVNGFRGNSRPAKGLQDRLCRMLIDAIARPPETAPTR